MIEVDDREFMALLTEGRFQREEIKALQKQVRELEQELATLRLKNAQDASS